eukprot:760870_1
MKERKRIEEEDRKKEEVARPTKPPMRSTHNQQDIEMADLPPVIANIPQNTEQMDLDKISNGVHYCIVANDTDAIVPSRQRFGLEESMKPVIMSAQEWAADELREMRQEEAKADGEEVEQKEHEEEEENEIKRHKITTKAIQMTCGHRECNNIRLLDANDDICASLKWNCTQHGAKIYWICKEQGCEDKSWTTIRGYLNHIISKNRQSGGTGHIWYQNELSRYGITNCNECKVLFRNKSTTMALKGKYPLHVETKKGNGPNMICKTCEYAVRARDFNMIDNIDDIIQEKATVPDTIPRSIISEFTEVYGLLLSRKNAAFINRNSAGLKLATNLIYLLPKVVLQYSNGGRECDTKKAKYQRKLLKAFKTGDYNQINAAATGGADLINNKYIQQIFNQNDQQFKEQYRRYIERIINANLSKYERENISNARGVALDKKGKDIRPILMFNGDLKIASVIGKVIAHEPLVARTLESQYGLDKKFACNIILGVCSVYEEYVQRMNERMIANTQSDEKEDDQEDMQQRMQCELSIEELEQIFITNGVPRQILNIDKLKKLQSHLRLENKLMRNLHCVTQSDMFAKHQRSN